MQFLRVPSYWCFMLFFFCLLIFAFLCGRTSPLTVLSIWPHMEWPMIAVFFGGLGWLCEMKGY